VGRWVKRYSAEGIQTRVMGVLLAHDRGHPLVFCLKNNITGDLKLLGGKRLDTETEKEALGRKLKKYFRPKGSSAAHVVGQGEEEEEGTREVGAHGCEIGDLVSQLWKPNFDDTTLPYLPSHVSRPKERQRIYQVILPTGGVFCLPPKYSLRPVAFHDLHQRGASPDFQLDVRGRDPVGRVPYVIANLPLLLSRYSLQTVVAEGAQIHAAPLAVRRQLAPVSGATEEQPAQEHAGTGGELQGASKPVPLAQVAARMNHS